MNLQSIKKGKQKSIVSVRIPNEIRAQVKTIAQSQSSDDVTVTESDVYREIIVSFFSEGRIHNVSESEVQS